jgi:hypothetical protein
MKGRIRILAALSAIAVVMVPQSAAAEETLPDCGALVNTSSGNVSASEYCLVEYEKSSLRRRRARPVVQQDPMKARGCTQLQASMTATRQPDGWLCPMRKRTPPDPNDPATIARQAALDLIAHHGSVGVLPGRTITGLPTYFWLDGVTTRTADRTQAGWHLHIVADPVTYTWRFGDGEQLTGGPGRAEPPQTSEIRHTSSTLGHYDISVQVTWRVTFQANGTTLPAPGTFTTTTSTPLTVDELRIRLTG